MKIIGSMIWLLTGFLISKEINKSKREYLRRVEAFIELIKFIRLKIECFVTPIPDILRECDLDTIRICSGKDSAPSSIEKMYEGIPNKRNNRGYKIIRNFCYSIGKGYKDSEIRLCDNSIRELTEHKCDLERRLPNDEKVCTTLWICVFGAILLIVL